MKKVLIIYRTLPQYRLEFYNLLREVLLERDIDLQLIYEILILTAGKTVLTLNGLLTKRTGYMILRNSA